MKIVVYSFLITLCNLLFAQPKIETDLTFPPEEYKQETIDYSKFNVYYTFSYVKNPAKSENRKESTTLLQIGDNYSKYFDFNNLELDSLKNELSKKTTVNASDVNRSLAILFKIQEKKTVFKNYKTGLIRTEGQIAGNNFLYEETEPKLDWKISQDTKIILDYNAKKATVKFRGRNWIAWYTEEIPITEGPHNFGGLPGLILELSDDQNHYSFNLKALDQNKKEIYRSEIKNQQKTSRMEFLEAEKNYHESPEMYFGNVKSKDDKGNPIKFDKAIPYNPIELE